MASPLSSSIADGTRLGSTPYSGESKPFSTDVVAVRRAIDLANLRYKAPRPSEGSLGAAAGASSGVPSSSFLPQVSSAVESVSSSLVASWDPVTQRYSEPIQPGKDHSIQGVRAAARSESGAGSMPLPRRVSDVGAARLFPSSAPRRLSGPILLDPLFRPSVPAIEGTKERLS